MTAIDIHAKELIRLLESDDTCNRCPTNLTPGVDQCRICWEFIIEYPL